MDGCAARRVLYSFTHRVCMCIYTFVHVCLSICTCAPRAHLREQQPVVIVRGEGERISRGRGGRKLERLLQPTAVLQRRRECGERVRVARRLEAAVLLISWSF